MPKFSCYAIKFKDGETNIVETWDECKKLTHGKKGMLFKGFSDREDADAWIEGRGIVPIDENGVNHIWIDGSTLSNGSSDSCGGFSVVYGKDDKRNLSIEVYPFDGYAVTNQLCELLASIESLKSVKNEKITKPTHIHSDSRYVLNYIVKKEKTGYQKHIVLFQELEKLIQELPNITFVKVKGHGGNAGSDEADRLAKLASHRVQSKKRKTLHTPEEDVDNNNNNNNNNEKQQCVNSPIDEHPHVSKKLAVNIPKHLLLSDD